MYYSKAKSLAPNRRELATQAMKAACAARSSGGLDQHSPICIFGLSDSFGIVVRFNEINMEGMYQRGIPPRIHLSSLRPPARRTFTCAHELGHHVLGHGSSIDELREESQGGSWDDPNELLADSFAGFVLMPVIGLRRSFAARGLGPESATAKELFTIACEFGVGYRTLLTHLSAGVNMLSRERAAILQRHTPKSLRTEILGASTTEPLLVADLNSVSSTIDAEVGMLLLLPAGTMAKGDSLILEQDIAAGRLFRAVRPGIGQAIANGGDWAVFVRVAPKGYTGLARYRHLEEGPDE